VAAWSSPSAAAPDGYGRPGRRLSVGGASAGVREPADVVQHHAEVSVRWAEPGEEDGVGPVIEHSGLVEGRCT
jgi:hypothetical protein